jgi:hypothetical protein
MKCVVKSGIYLRGIAEYENSTQDRDIPTYYMGSRLYPRRRSRSAAPRVNGICAHIWMHLIYMLLSVSHELRGMVQMCDWQENKKLLSLHIRDRIELTSVVGSDPAEAFITLGAHMDEYQGIFAWGKV